MRKGPLPGLIPGFRERSNMPIPGPCSSMRSASFRQAFRSSCCAFLQEKVIQRVGGREDISVDARVVSATNVDIETAIREGAFREDLYYRTAVITIHLPPLRERGDDILLLANLFLRRFSDGLHRKVKGFRPRCARPAPFIRMAGQCARAGKQGAEGCYHGRLAFSGAFRPRF